MLEELKQIQREGGLEVEVCFMGDNVYVKKTIIFSVAFVMGDCKDNDALAGRFGSHTKGARKISRACDCRSSNANDPDFKCEFIQQKDVQDAIMSRDLDRLKELSQHHVKNAFHDLCFGGDPHGIHGCTPVDIVVHVSQLGLYKYLMKIFFDKELKTSASAAFDSLVKQFYSLPRQRAASCLPRTDFGSGISNITGLTAAEYSGCLFAIAMILITPQGNKLCDGAMGHEVDKERHTKANKES